VFYFCYYYYYNLGFWGFFFLLLLLLFCFLRQGLPMWSCCPGTRYLDQAIFKNTRESPASASQELGLKPFVNTPGSQELFKGFLLLFETRPVELTLSPNWRSSCLCLYLMSVAITSKSPHSSIKLCEINFSSKRRTLPFTDCVHRC